MQLFSHRTSLLPVFLLILLVCFGYNPVQAETKAGDGSRPQPNLNLSGLYLGFTPCDDCQGIKTTLALNGNKTYVFITQYVGKSDREFVEKGKFGIDESANKIVLTPRKGSVTEQQYLIDDNMLIKLDEDGNRITKDGADRYILHRKDIMKTPVDSHGSH